MEATIAKSAVGEAEMAAWEVPYKSVLGFLLRTSMLAARYGLGKDAERILAPLEAVRPRHASAQMARALVCIYLGRPQEAIDRLEAGLLKDDPRHDMGRAIKALGEYHLGRLRECRALVRALQEQAAADPQSVCSEARDLASSLAAEIGQA